jgi:hypothetical protein
LNIKTTFDKLGGLRPVVGDTFIPVTEAEVVAVEDRLSVRLPEPYRSFLMTYGASAFNECVEFRPVVRFPPELSSSGKGPFSLFYGSEAPAHEGYGLLRRMRFFSGRIPDTLLPIADDGMVDQICLGVRGTEAGKVYFWDLQNEPLTEEEYLEDYGEPMPFEEKFRNVYLIAESFEDFLRRLEVKAD